MPSSLWGVDAMIESSVTVKGQTTLLVQPTSRLYRSLPYDGPAVSLEDMDRAVAEGATEG